MSELDTIVGGAITADTLTTPREGFGVQAMVVYHTKNTDHWRDYASANDMLADGFTTHDPAYRMVAVAFEQNPSPQFVRVIRGTTPVAHTVKLTATDATVGKTVSVLITDAAGVEHTISRVNVGGDTTATIATAIGALIAALTGVASATVTGSDIVVTITTAGDVWFYDSLLNLDYLDQTPSAAPDVDLANAMLLDDAFYGVTIALGSKANIDLADAWCETNKKLGLFQTADSQEKRAGTSVLGAAITAASLTHTLPMYHSKPKQYMACAWLGLMLPKDPGSATFALKQLAGVDVDALSTTEKNALNANGLNYYVKAGARGVTRKDGKVGSGQFADIIVGNDWLDNEIKSAVFDDIAQKDKVNFDDGGIAEIEHVIDGVLKLAVERNFLTAGNGADVPAPFVVAMKVTDVPSADRGNRKLSGVKFGGRYASAIHAVGYAGSLTNA